MVGLLLPVMLAVMAAGLRAGSIAGLRRLSVAWWPLALASLGAQLVLHNPPFNQQTWALSFGPALWVVCLAAMLLVLLRNATRGGSARAAWRLGAVGVGLTLAVVVANGGYMPQSAEARLAVRGAALPNDANVAQLYNVTAAGPASRLAWLGDVIPQPRWLPKANVVSIGDLILSFSAAWLVYITMVAQATHGGRRTADS